VGAVLVYYIVVQGILYYAITVHVVLMTITVHVVLMTICISNDKLLFTLSSYHNVTYHRFKNRDSARSGGEITSPRTVYSATQLGRYTDNDCTRLTQLK